MEHDILDSELKGDNLDESNVDYAGFGVRAGASLLDALVLTPIVGLNFLNIIEYKILPVALFFQTISFLYKPLMEGKYGATLGKKAVNIAVVGTDFNPISMKDSFIRNSPWAIAFIIGLFTTGSMFMSAGFDNIESFIAISEANKGSSLNLVNQIYNVVFLVIIVSVIFDKRKQGLHDQLAKTFVIRK